MTCERTAKQGRKLLAVVRAAMDRSARLEWRKGGRHKRTTRHYLHIARVLVGQAVLDADAGRCRDAAKKITKARAAFKAVKE